MDPHGEEAGARRRLTRFLDERAAHYADERDLLSVPNTSMLSADLHFGTISPVTVLEALDGREPGHRAFRRQVAWRDF